MANNNRKNNFVMQAGILAAAGIISRIIGLLYRSPLTAIIGEEGIGYYQAAYHMYTIILLISSYSVPSAVSKVIAQKLAVKEYRNAHRIFICSVWYVLIVGSVASFILFFCAGFLEEGAAVTVLKVFAPTVFLSGLLGVLRGYFQAHKSMVQTSISQIIEQILNAVFSIVVAQLLINHYISTLEPGTDISLGTETGTQVALYGAMGSAIGTGVGVLSALLFMWWIYSLNKKTVKRKVRHDNTQYVESYEDISRLILMVVTPFILSTAIYNLSTSLNSTLYIKISHHVKEVDVETAHYFYGIFSGQAQTISNIPIAFASAMASAVIPVIAQLVAMRDIKGACRKIFIAVKSTMIISIPSAVGLFILAKPITALLFPRSDEVVTLASRLLMTLSLSVIFYALSTLNGTILQGMGKVKAPIKNAAIALVIQTILLVSLLLFTELDLYALAISCTVYSGLMCILNQLSVSRAIGYHQEWIKTFFIPAFASIMMGAICWAVYEGVYLMTSSNVISLIPAVIIGCCIYFAVLLLCGGVTERELRRFPKGYLLVRIAKKFRLLK